MIIKLVLSCFVDTPVEKDDDDDDEEEGVATELGAGEGHDDVTHSKSIVFVGSLCDHEPLRLRAHGVMNLPS
jgi:hypothetical protein